MADYSWDNCPVEVLSHILNNLQPSTLLICMKVSSKWRDVAYYIMKRQDGGLEKVLSKRLEDGGIVYRRKSNIRYPYLSSLLWYNINDAEIHCAGPVSYGQIRHISIYKDNLIIVNNEGVTYLDVDTLRARRHYDLECDKFEESDYMVVAQKTGDRDELTLAIYPKSSSFDYTFTNNRKIHITTMVYKLHERYCYVINRLGQLSVIIRCKSKTALRPKFISRYYGSICNVAAIHVTCDGELYIITTCGNILRYDSNNFRTISSYLRCDLSKFSYKYTVTTFHRFGAVFRTASTFDLKYDYEMDFIMMKCPGVTCVTDHGNVLILGHDDGLVKIYIKSKLRKNDYIPERMINVEKYLSDKSSCEIRAIEVHEKVASHILFVKTDTEIVKLLISNPKLIDNVENVENIDEVILSIIHLLKIDV